MMMKPAQRRITFGGEIREEVRWREQREREVEEKKRRRNLFF